MRLENPIESLAASLYHALNVSLSDIEYEEYQTIQDKKAGKPPVIEKRRPTIDEVDIVQFPQTWGSTALGIGLVGGSAISYAYTVVVSCVKTKEAAVYFGGNLGYVIKNPNSVFKEDVKNYNLKHRLHIDQYMDKSK